MSSGSAPVDPNALQTALGHILRTDTHETLATATFPCDLHPCRSLPCLCSPTSMLFPPAAAEWAKPSRSAAATAGRPHGV